MHHDFDRIHADIYSLLRSLGVQANHTYFFYTAYAIALLADNPLRSRFFIGAVLIPTAEVYHIPVSTLQNAIHWVAEEAFLADTILFANIFPGRPVLSIEQFVNIAVCSAVDDDVKARYDSQKSKGKKGLVAEIDNYEVYALTWDDVFQSFDLRHAFLLDKLKMDKEAIAAEIAQTAGDEKSKDTADALTALVAN